jgi:FkbM family methyltransferase
MGRQLLGLLTTYYTRRKTGLDARVFFDQVWIHRVGGDYLADSTRFRYAKSDILRWMPGPRNVFDEHRDWWFYRYQPQPGHVILDIGAATGEDMLIFSKVVGPRGRVLSVEAHPGTFRLLELTRQWNNLVNATIVWRAVMAGEGKVFIEDRSDAGDLGNTICPSPSERHRQLEVNGVTVDQLCAEHGITHIDFLKMNIEGAERLAIQGMCEMINRTRYVCICCHDFIAGNKDFYRTKAAVVDFLRKHDFEVTLREDHSDPWVRDIVYGRRIA